jgi:hypothetical protein
MKYFFYLFITVTLFSCHNKNDNSENGDFKIKLKETNVTILEDKINKNQFRNCKAHLENENLILTLNDKPYSEYSRELKITNKFNKYILDFHETESITDSSYVLPVFKIIKQHLTLNNKGNKIGDSINGEIDIEIKADYKWVTVYTDTIKIKGKIYCIIE